MKINIDYNGQDRNGLEKQILLAAKEAGVLFDKKPASIDVKIFKTRKEYDDARNRKSCEWEIASANDGRIDILHPDAFEKESSHGRDEFLPTLKHEFAHIFLDKLADGHRIPSWLNEGLANHVAGLGIPKGNFFIEDDFCKKLGTQKGWDEQAGYYAYQTARLFVEFLIKKHSAEKVLKLISALDRNYYYDDFNEIFERIIGSDLEQAEKEFVRALNAGR